MYGISCVQELNACMVQQMVTVQLKKLNIAGGTTESIYPEAENMLFSDTYNQKALFAFAGNKKVGYRSVMDFLHAETFRSCKMECFLYYNDRAPQFRYVATPDSVAAIGEVLCDIIRTCRELWEKESLLDKWKT